MNIEYIRDPFHSSFQLNNFPEIAVETVLATKECSWRSIAFIELQFHNFNRTAFYMRMGMVLKRVPQQYIGNSSTVQKSNDFQVKRYLIIAIIVFFILCI